MIADSKEKLVEDFRVRTIQEAALRVIGSKGLADATIQEIANEAGVAKGTIYLYFESKEDLVRRTAELALAELRTRLEATVDVPRPLPEQIRSLVRAKIEFFDAHREFFRIYLAASKGDMDRDRRQTPEYQRNLQRWAAVLTEAMDRGEIRRMDPLRLTAFMAEGVNAIVLRRLTEEDPPGAESDVEWIASVLMHGVAAEGGSAS